MSQPKCPRCGETTPSKFGEDKGRASGFRPYCRACDALNSKERYHLHAEKRRAAERKRYHARKARAAASDFEITVEEPAPELPPEQKTDPVGISVEQLPEIVDPLAAAYAEREQRKEKIDTKKQRDALMTENDRLRARIDAQDKILAPLEVVVYEQPEWKRCDAVACGSASDWHMEEEVKKEAVHGLNEYNLDIARYRASKFFQHLLRLAEIQARDSVIRDIYLATLGDMTSNWIHKELLASTLLAPGDAAHFFVESFCAGLDYLLRESSFTIRGTMIPGNHGRMTEQVHFSDPTGTSLETFAYRAILKRYDGNPRVQLKVATQAMVYETFFERFTMRMVHGYEVKYGGGVGGITIPLNKAIAQWDVAKRADLTVLGHFHQLMLDGGPFIANGSLIGYNTYAQAIKARFEEPRQAFWLIHARNGGTKSVCAPIWLDDAHHEEAA